MERIEALHFLVKSVNGCTTPIMVHHGCTMPTIRGLVREGLASVERAQIRRKRSWRAVFRLRITSAGRRAMEAAEKLIAQEPPCPGMTTAPPPRAVDGSGYAWPDPPTPPSVEQALEVGRRNGSLHAGSSAPTASPG
jgi:hypothetical protein